MAESKKKLRKYVVQLPPSGAKVWPPPIEIRADEIEENEYGLILKREDVVVFSSVPYSAWWISGWAN
ncbi:MAG: hypothetical protein F4Z51_08650 [Chloroflexi bacterium]|nr:hypothetical protein [Chloroflexota bacterium]MYD16902.1 hypothetical protein [Chloroflexota bacterium]MYJ00780.1 hypothetical protein [Chloroflexota bacterium]